MRRITNQRIRQELESFDPRNTMIDICRNFFDLGYNEALKNGSVRNYTAADIDKAFFEGRKSAYDIDVSPAFYLLKYKERLEND